MDNQIPYAPVRLRINIYFDKQKFWNWFAYPATHVQPYCQEHYIYPPASEIHKHQPLGWMYMVVQGYCTKFVIDLFNATPDGQKYHYWFEYEIQPDVWVYTDYYDLGDSTKELMR